MLTKKHKVKMFPDETVLPKKAISPFLFFNKDMFEEVSKKCHT